MHAHVCVCVLCRPEAVFPAGLSDGEQNKVRLSDQMRLAALTFLSTNVAVCYSLFVCSVSLCFYCVRYFLVVYLCSFFEFHDVHCV